MKKNQVAIIAGAPVVETLSKLELALESLKRIQETPWKTNGEYPGFKNIKNDSSITEKDLIRLEAQIYTQSKLYDEAAARMGKNKYPAFEINGGTYEDWHHDIMLRTNINAQEEKYTTLKKFQEEMKQFLSKEDQKAQLEAKIHDYFQSM